MGIYTPEYAYTRIKDKTTYFLLTLLILNVKLKCWRWPIARVKSRKIFERAS